MDVPPCAMITHCASGGPLIPIMNFAFYNPHAMTSQQMSVQLVCLDSRIVW